MTPPKSILFYHLLAVKGWRKISDHLLQNIPQTHVAVNIFVTKRYLFNAIAAYRYFRRNPKVKYIFINYNKRHFPEVAGFEKLRRRVPLDDYSILTYMHGKGVTKPHSQPVYDWREFLRYFIMDRFADTVSAFDDGYVLYGPRLRVYSEEEFGPRAHTYLYCDFWYEGNFLSVNLERVRDKVRHQPIQKHYLGLEAWWENLCTLDEAFNAFSGFTEMNLYRERLLPEMYKTQ